MLIVYCLAKKILSFQLNIYRSSMIKRLQKPTVISLLALVPLMLPGIEKTAIPEPSVDASASLADTDEGKKLADNTPAVATSQIVGVGAETVINAITISPASPAQPAKKTAEETSDGDPLEALPVQPDQETAQDRLQTAQEMPPAVLTNVQTPSSGKAGHKPAASVQKNPTSPSVPAEPVPSLAEQPSTIIIPEQVSQPDKQSYPIKIEFIEEIHSKPPNLEADVKAQDKRPKPHQISAEAKIETLVNATPPNDTSTMPITSETKVYDREGYDGQVKAPTLSTPSSNSDLYRYFQGTLKATGGFLFFKPPYDYQIVAANGTRLAYLDTNALVLNQPLEYYVGKIVTVYGEVANPESSANLVIRVQTLTNQ